MVVASYPKTARKKEKKPQHRIRANGHGSNRPFVTKECGLKEGGKGGGVIHYSFLPVVMELHLNMMKAI